MTQAAVCSSNESGAFNGPEDAAWARKGPPRLGEQQVPEGEICCTARRPAGDQNSTQISNSGNPRPGLSRTSSDASWVPGTRGRPGIQLAGLRKGFPFLPTQSRSQLSSRVRCL